MSSVKARDEVVETLRESLRGTMAAIRRLRGRETHRPGELSFAQYSLLFFLADGELSAGSLASSAALSPASVTQMLDALESAGLLARTRSQRDKRVVLVSLTDRGRSVLAERRARFERIWRAALEEFDERELAAASTVLNRLQDLFEEMDAG